MVAPVIETFVFVLPCSDARDDDSVSNVNLRDARSDMLDYANPFRGRECGHRSFSAAPGAGRRSQAEGNNTVLWSSRAMHSRNINRIVYLPWQN